MPANPENSLRLYWLICLGLTALACAAGIVSLILSYRKNKRRASASYSWFTTPGAIIESSMHKSGSRSGAMVSYILEDGKFRRGTQNDRFTFYVKVIFSYQVMGQAYRGRNIFAGHTFALLHDEAQATLARYPEGAAVTVYYDPDNPADGFLERPIPPSTTPLYLGIIFLGFALCMIVGFVLLYTLRVTTGG